MRTKRFRRLSKNHWVRIVIWTLNSCFIRCCFTVNQSDSTLYLCAEDEDDMFFWVEALNGAASGTTISKETVLIQEGLKKTGVQEISPDALSFDQEVIGKGESSTTTFS